VLVEEVLYLNCKFKPVYGIVRAVIEVHEYLVFFPTIFGPFLDQDNRVE